MSVSLLVLLAASHWGIGLWIGQNRIGHLSRGTSTSVIVRTLSNSCFARSDTKGTAMGGMS